MATLEELVVSLVAETSGLRSELKKATAETAKATEKMNTAIGEMTTNSSQNMGAFQNALSTMAGFVGGSLILGAFEKLKNTVTGLFNTFVTDGVAAAKAQEDAINKLNTALALAGQYSRETSKEMQAFASALQTTTKYGDEAILETSALIQALGGLEKDGLKRATQAAVDMSAALGIDLKAAATLVGKAAVGEVSSFSRYGVAIEKGATSAETLTNALNSLEKKFGGSAANQVKTFSGLQQQLKNSFGDLTEEIGFVITKNQTLLNVMTEMNKIINGYTAGVNENRNAMQELVAKGLIFFLDVGGVVITALDQLGRAWQVVTGVVNALLIPIGALVAAFKIFTGDVEGAKTSFNENIELMKKQLNAFSSENETSLGNLAQTFADLSVAGQKGLDAIKTGADNTIEPINNTKEAVKELSAEEKKRMDALQAYADALIANADNTQMQYDAELESLQYMLDEKLIIESDYHDKRNEMLAEKQAAELAQLQAAKDAGLITEAEFQKAKTQLEKQQAAESRKVAEEKKKFDEELKKKEEAAYKKLQDGILILAQSSNKKVAAAAKALATYDATMKAYQAIQNALANVPFPANIAAAAGIGIQAFANVAKINGMSFNKGGAVPGPNINKDIVPAMLTPGENVVDRSTNEKLNAFLDSGATGGGVTIRLEMAKNVVDFIEAEIIERQKMGVSRFTTQLG